MDAEAVERIVVAEHVLEAGAAPVADHARGDADRKGPDRPDESRGRRDGDEASHGTRADADDGRLAAQRPLHQHPGEAGHRRGDLGDQHRHAGLHAGGDGGAGVEPEPADPQQRGADESQHHVVRRPGVGALAEHDGAH